MDWDDYKYFTALSSTLSVRAAASSLGVNASTVSRRLELFERRLGVTLFTRSAKGLVITPEGAEVVARVESVAKDLGDIEGHLIGRDKKLSGTVRVIIPEVLALSLLIQELPRFQNSYPDIELHILPSHQGLDVSRREADITMQVTNNPTESLVGRILAPTAVAPYATKSLIARLEKNNGDLDHSKLPWVDWVGDSEISQTCRGLLKTHVPDMPVSISTHSLLLHLEAARKGLGLAFLPCILAESDKSLHRIEAIQPVFGPPMWMLVHPDLRHTLRITVFIEFVRDVFSRRRHELLVSGMPNLSEN
ncbi:MAG: DNA-binding transcriptional LysR family regulator [Candidatus Azotimanducaceae bacterium]